MTFLVIAPGLFLASGLIIAFICSRMSDGSGNESGMIAGYFVLIFGGIPFIIGVILSIVLSILTLLGY